MSDSKGDASAEGQLPAFETLTWEVHEGILTLRLSRADRLNAFTVTMAEELVTAFDRAGEDDEVRAIVVTGEGRAFCAGMDLSVPGNVFGLNETMTPSIEQLRSAPEDPGLLHGVRDTGGLVVLAILQCPKPVIAAINGPAVGVGATMSLAMDVRMASSDASFTFAFAKLGIVPESCSSQLLPRLVGTSRALEWFYTAETVSAEAAQAAGLVRSVHAADDLLPAAYALAASFTHNRSPLAVALTRQLVLRNQEPDVDTFDAHLAESLAMFYTSQGDGREGIAAFREKRPPQFGAAASQALPLFGFLNRRR